MLKIRAHHLLCTKNFVGEGYSSDFLKNMKKILSKLSENPNIEIVDHVDDICLYCPENIDGKCKTFEKVYNYDRKVLKILDILPNEILNYSDIEKKTYDIIVTKERREAICGDCQWNDLCKDVENKKSGG